MSKKVEKNSEEVSTKEVKTKESTNKAENTEDVKNTNSNKVAEARMNSINQAIMSKLVNIYRMKRQLSIAKYSASLSGYNNNLNVKKLRKDIARELTEIRKNFK